ncbi:MAG TPA: cytochrome c oxidase subunit 3 [Candidatus Dormibacteraeota bacterium]|nr:cytochrome c oxidase subunit 3 [Candidatus Dormibacteraeota bacterium]
MDAAATAGRLAAVEPGVEAQHRKLRIATLLLIASDVVFVTCLFFTYLYLHALNVEGRWLPAGVQPPSAASGVLLAALLVLSAASYRWADLGVRQGDLRRLRTGLGVALGLVVVELLYALWQLAHLGFGPGSGSFADSFIVLSGYHFVHLLLVVLLGAMVLNRARHGRYGPGRAIGVELVGYVWYWVALMAVAMALLALV